MWRGKVERVHDGDTIRVAWDLGVGVATSEWLRVDDADTPELHTGPLSEQRRALTIATAMADVLVGAWVRFWTWKVESEPGAQERTFVRYRARVEFYAGGVWQDLATYIDARGYNKPGFVRRGV
jgi:endonuclease YncB( thermonuclease family)